MKRTPLTAMLTLSAAVAATFAIAGCGGKSSTSESTSGTTSTVHKHSSKPAY